MDYTLDEQKTVVHTFSVLKDFMLCDSDFSLWSYEFILINLIIFIRNLHFYQLSDQCYIFNLGMTAVRPVGTGSLDCQQKKCLSSFFLVVEQSLVQDLSFLSTCSKTLSVLVLFLLCKEGILNQNLSGISLSVYFIISHRLLVAP